ncbi:unnamed protein product, partial [Amoebophrya sp. A120]|eukprot:GSA120T00010639001.1
MSLFSPSHELCDSESSSVEDEEDDLLADDLVPAKKKSAKPLRKKAKSAARGHLVRKGATNEKKSQSDRIYSVHSASTRSTGCRDNQQGGNAELLRDATDDKDKHHQRSDGLLGTTSSSSSSFSYNRGRVNHVGPPVTHSSVASSSTTTALGAEGSNTTNM